MFILYLININSKVETKQDREVEITVDISGSEGAAIEGTYNTKKTIKLRPRATQDLCSVKLFGDWLLRIKFTYTIKNYGKGSGAPKNMVQQKMINNVNVNDLDSLI